MAVCAICGKKSHVGYNVSHSNNHTKRRWSPNLQKIRTVLPSGEVQRLTVCSRCLSAGKVKKAAPRGSRAKALAAAGKK